MKNPVLYVNMILILMLPIQVVIPSDSTETTVRLGGGQANYVSSVESMIIGYSPEGCGGYSRPIYRYDLEEDQIQDFGIEIDHRPASSQIHFGIRGHRIGTTKTGSAAVGINPYFGTTGRLAAFNAGIFISDNRVIGMGGNITPTLALRLGPPGFHLSFSYLSDVPLLSNGMSQLGFGIQPFGQVLDIWVGASGVFYKGTGLLAKTNLWVSPRLGLHASLRRGSYRIGKAQADENSVSLGMTFKLTR